MRVTWVSRIGGRKVNEDAVGKLTKNGITCIAVADGLGGHNAGEVASRTAVDTILKRFSEEPEFSREALTRYVTEAHNAVFEKSTTDPDYLHMSSTIVVLLIKGRRSVWCHVGDSRLYRFRNGWITEVTEDHSIAFRDFMEGLIEYGEIRNSSNQNKLTNAVGQYIENMVISQIRTADSATSFLLCTDGWWEYVTEEEMEETLRESYNSREWLEKMLEIRENTAPEGSDNYTAAVVFM